MLEIESDGQEAIVTQFADGPVSWNESGMSVKGHMCCVLGAWGRGWSALRVRYSCKFLNPYGYNPFWLSRRWETKLITGSHAEKKIFSSLKNKKQQKRLVLQKKIKNINHIQSPLSENETQTFTFTIKSDRHMACVFNKGTRPCVQWSEYKQYSLLPSNKPGDMRKGLRTGRVHINLLLWTGFHLKY